MVYHVQFDALKVNKVNFDGVNQCKFCKKNLLLFTVLLIHTNIQKTFLFIYLLIVLLMGYFIY